MQNKTMRMTLLLGLIVFALVAFAVATTRSASAQDPSPVPITLPSCREVSRYDHNGDGRVNGDDFGMWVWTVHESGGECRLNGPAGGCPAWVDVNRDGIVSVADLDAMQHFVLICVWPSPIVRPQ